MLAAVLTVFAALAIPPPTALVVVYRPHGDAMRGARAWTLACTPPSGTHPRPGAACRELLVHPDALRPASRPCRALPRPGSPEAEVLGAFNGNTIDRTFVPSCGPWWRDLHSLLTGT